MTNIKPVKLGNNVRMSFAKINEVLDMPNLIEVQKKSYQWFLTEGLREVFEETAANEAVAALEAELAAENEQ